MTEIDLCALVSSRICHDLISPIGAIGNGVELMSGLGAGPGPELGLIGDSVNSASGKLRYFRIAFGAAGDGARVQTSEMQLVTGLMFQGRTTVTVDAGAADVPRSIGKLALLCLLCLEKSLPMGGRIMLTLAECHFEATAASDRFRPLPDRWALLDGRATTEDIGPADVQFILLGQALRLARAHLATEFTDSGAVMRLSALSP